MNVSVTALTGIAEDYVVCFRTAVGAKLGNLHEGENGPIRPVGRREEEGCDGFRVLVDDRHQLL